LEARWLGQGRTNQVAAVSFIELLRKVKAEVAWTPMKARGLGRVGSGIRCAVMLKKSELSRKLPPSSLGP
jgi:hypothetical protein